MDEEPRSLPWHTHGVMSADLPATPEADPPAPAHSEGAGDDATGAEDPKERMRRALAAKQQRAASPPQRGVGRGGPGTSGGAGTVSRRREFRRKSG